MDRGFLPKIFKLTVGDTSATCARCGGDAFVKQRLFRRSMTDMLACVACGAETSYTALLGQISRIVGERAQRALRDARAYRSSR